MSDTLYIKNIQVNTQIGVLPFEQKIKQRLVINIEITLNFQSIADRIENTIDYCELTSQLIDFIESKEFKLIETVAEESADFLKKNFDISKLSVQVEKPGALSNGVVGARVIR